MQHGAGQYILGFCVRGHTETGHINTNDAHAVDFFGQQLQGHATGRGHTQIDDDDAIEFVRVGLFVHSFAYVFKQLACHQSLGVERHIAHGATRTIKMGSECQTVNTAGRAAQYGGSATHAQTDTQ